MAYSADATVIYFSVAVVIFAVGAVFLNRLIDLFTNDLFVGAGPLSFRTLSLEVGERTGLAKAGYIVVGLAVAVVVDAVASFGAGFYFSVAGAPGAAHTKLHSAFAWTCPLGVVGSSVASLTEVLVDVSVTVVVFAVAERLVGLVVRTVVLVVCRVAGFPTLGSGAGLAQSDANPKAFGARWTSQVLVGLTIAVVVLTVAELLSGADLSAARSPLSIGLASLLAVLANACVLGFGVAVVAGGFLAGFADADFIHLAITVVVLAVTGFGLWRQLTLADTPLTRLAGLGAGLADTFAFVALPIRHTALRRGVAGFVEVFIDLPIAVVVFVVTEGFCDLVGAVVFGVFGDSTGEPAFGAVTYFFGTLANPCVFFTVGDVGQVVIDLTVAVIVLAVASLCARIQRTLTGFPLAVAVTGL